MKTHFLRFLNDQNGNLVAIFAFLALPVLIAIGMGLDYARCYSVKLELQADLDAAVLAVAKKLSIENDETIESEVRNWFAAQSGHRTLEYSLDDLSVSVGTQEVTAVAKATVPTTLMALAHIDTVNVSASSTAAAAGASFLNVYIVLDKSASMLLAATKSGQSSLEDVTSQINECAFACHEPEGGSYQYRGRYYDTVYDLSVAMQVKLRTDVAIDAVHEVLDIIDEADASHTRIRVGLYAIGQTAKEVLAPTFSLGTARAKLADDGSGLTSATSEPASYFDRSFSALADMIGKAGDGNSATSPKKLVLILTDGVQSERNWVLQKEQGIRFPTNYTMLQTVVTPLNPDWCSGMKGNKVSVGVLYTRYLPLPDDWGYRDTLAKTMASSAFEGIWKGRIAPNDSGMARQAYIPTALSACATNSSLYLQADSPSEIEAGLSSLFTQYMSMVRLSR